MGIITYQIPIMYLDICTINYTNDYYNLKKRNYEFNN